MKWGLENGNDWGLCVAARSFTDHTYKKKTMKCYDDDDDVDVHDH